MGEFRWPVGVWSVDRERMESLFAMVDTGASYSVFPESMLERLGVWRLERVGFEQADGSVIEFDVGVAWMTINGRERASSVAFGSDDVEPLLGANALQEFLLLVDPVAEELVLRTGRLKSNRDGWKSGRVLLARRSLELRRRAYGNR